MSLLEVKHISKRFGGLKAINDVSFAVKPARGDVYCRTQRRRQNYAYSTSSPAFSIRQWQHSFRRPRHLAS